MGCRLNATSTAAQSKWESLVHSFDMDLTLSGETRVTNSIIPSESRWCTILLTFRAEMGQYFES
jgi:hypothetical protein